MREYPRKHWGSRSAVLACSPLFPARGTAKGPQLGAKGDRKRSRGFSWLGRTRHARRLYAPSRSRHAGRTRYATTSRRSRSNVRSKLAPRAPLVSEILLGPCRPSSNTTLRGARRILENYAESRWEPAELQRRQPSSRSPDRDRRRPGIYSLRMFVRGDWSAPASANAPVSFCDAQGRTSRDRQPGVPGVPARMRELARRRCISLGVSADYEPAKLDWNVRQHAGRVRERLRRIPGAQLHQGVVAEGPKPGIVECGETIRTDWAAFREQ
jgi:hypothetical protein